jgi:hypothetical protein
LPTLRRSETHSLKNNLETALNKFSPISRAANPGSKTELELILFNRVTASLITRLTFLDHYLKFGSSGDRRKTRSEITVPRKHNICLMGDLSRTERTHLTSTTEWACLRRYRLKIRPVEHGTPTYENRAKSKHGKVVYVLAFM